jgi:hypothetical protein
MGDMMSNGRASFAAAQKAIDRRSLVLTCEQLSTDDVKISPRDREIECCDAGVLVALAYVSIYEQMEKIVVAKK